MLKYYFTKQFAIFLVVGGVAGLLNWGACMMLTKWFSFSSAIVFAYMIGMMVAFMLNHRFVFPHSTKATRVQATQFVLVNLLCIPVVWFISIQVSQFLTNVHFFWFHKELAHAVGIASPVLFTFLIYKFFTFKRGRDLSENL